MATVLIAEDGETVREFIDAGLRGSGHATLLARDGAEVLALLSGPTPDLILMDLHMPVLDGLETLRRLRAASAWPDVPVLFLTASDLIQDMVEARRLGARGYLVKPLRLSTLVERVGRVLNEPGLTWIDDMTEAHDR